MTTVTIAPNATITANGIVQNAATAHQAVTDSSDVSDLVLGGDFTFELSSFALPANSIVRSANALGRGSRGYYSGSMLTTLTTLDTPIVSFSLMFPYAVVDNVAGTPAAILVSDQAGIDSLRLNISNTVTVVSSEYYVYLKELAVELVYVAPPTVTVTAPSGELLVATTTLTWTHVGDVDADTAGAQQRYQAKVFTAAQHGAAGFDPATAVPLWDSGEQMSGATSTTVGPLLNAANYKAFVRTAENVNGAPLWSAWAAGPAFTINTDPPYVATITATPGADRVEVSIVRDLAHTDWTHVNVERSVIDQTHWQPVRGALELAAPDDTVVVYDYEMPEGVDLWYRARGIIWSGAAIVAQGPWMVTSAPAVWTVEECGEYLRDPATGNAVLVELLVDDATISTQHHVGVLTVVGRASPVTVWDTPSLPVGAMSVVTRTFADGAALLELLRTAPVLLYQGRYDWGHPYRWMVVTDHATSRQPTADLTFRDYRVWTIAYVEVDRPPVLA